MANEIYFDTFSKNVARRGFFAAVGAVLLGGSFGRAETLANCNAYCTRFPGSANFLACRQKCLACPSVSQLCGTTAQNLVCCDAGQTCTAPNVCV